MEGRKEGRKRQKWYEPNREGIYILCFIGREGDSVPHICRANYHLKWISLKTNSVWNLSNVSSHLSTCTCMHYSISASSQVPRRVIRATCQVSPMAMEGPPSTDWPLLYCTHSVSHPCLLSYSNSSPIDFFPPLTKILRSSTESLTGVTLSLSLSLHLPPCSSPVRLALPSVFHFLSWQS